MSPHDNTNLADMHTLLQEWKDLHEMQEYEMQEFDHLGVTFPSLKLTKSKSFNKFSKGVGKIANMAKGDFGKASTKWLDYKLAGDKGRFQIMKDLFVHIQGELPNIDDEHITEMKEALSQINAKYNNKTIKDHWLETSEAKTEKEWQDAGDTNRKQYMTAFIEKINTWFNGQVDNNVVTRLKDACIKMEMFKPKWTEIVLAYQKM
jgi:hypothetical protein